MEELTQWWAFYRHGVAFAAATAAVWALVHEVVKYAVKRWVLKVPYK